MNLDRVNESRGEKRRRIDAGGRNFISSNSFVIVELIFRQVFIPQPVV